MDYAQYLCMAIELINVIINAHSTQDTFSGVIPPFSAYNDKNSPLNQMNLEL